jgi:beta-lactam-binding protein with PASTA domain
MRVGIVLIALVVGGCAQVMSTVRPARTGSFPMFSVIGKTLAGAQETAAVEGKTGTMDVKETECNDESVAEGTICDQSPPAGQSVLATTPWIVYVQKKRDPMFPDVTGLLPDEATRKIKAAGWSEIDVREMERPPEGCQAGRVCTTTPKPNTRAYQKLPVSVFVRGVTAPTPSSPEGGRAEPATTPPAEERKPDPIF